MLRLQYAVPPGPCSRFDLPPGVTRRVEVSGNRVNQKEPHMLTVSENAQAVVKGLTESEELPDTAGLRLAVGPDQAQLEVSVVREPQATDVSVEAGEGNVYLAEDAAVLLEGQTLDAAQTDEGVGFTLTPQA